MPTHGNADHTIGPVEGEGRLPTRDAEVERNRHWPAGQPGTDPARADEAGPLVLVVDDDDCVRSVLRDLLETCGYRVAQARDGFEAVHAAQELRPRAVLMDLALPLSDGIECTSALKQHAETAEIPVVAITGSWLGGQPEALASAGFAGALRKPCQGSLLLRELERVLAASGHGSRPALRRA